MKDYEFLFKWKQRLKDPSQDVELMGDIVKLVQSIKKETLQFVLKSK